MRKLIAAASVAAVAATLALSTPAQASCTPGPRGQESDTFHFTNPQTQGRQYLNVDADGGQAYVGTTNQAGTAYEEVVITWGAGGPSIEVYHRNPTGPGDYRATVSSSGFSECGQLGSV